MLTLLLALSPAADTIEHRTDEPVVLSFLPGRPEVADGKIFAGSEGGQVVAYDMATGRQLWTFKKERRATNRPLYHDGLVMLGGFDGILHAVDADTGELQWEFKAGEAGNKWRDKFINGVPTVVGDRVVFSSEDYHVYCLNVKTGKEIWRRKLGEEPQAFEHPVVDGAVLVGAWDGHLYSIDMKDGALRWRSETEFMPRGKTVWRDGRNLYERAPGEEQRLKSEQAPHLTCVPAVDADHIYVSRWSGELIALDRKTGKQVWGFSPDTKDAFDVGGRFYVVEHDGVVTYGTSDDGHIYGIDAKTGKVKWTRDIGSPVFGPVPGVGGVAIYAQHSSTGLFAYGFDVATGDARFTVEGVTSLPTIVDGSAYFSQIAEGGRGFVLAAIDMKTGERTWILRTK